MAVNGQPLTRPIRRCCWFIRHGIRVVSVKNRAHWNCVLDARTLTRSLLNLHGTFNKTVHYKPPVPIAARYYRKPRLCDLHDLAARMMHTTDAVVRHKLWNWCWCFGWWWWWASLLSSWDLVVVPRRRRGRRIVHCIWTFFARISWWAIFTIHQKPMDATHSNGRTGYLTGRRTAAVTMRIGLVLLFWLLLRSGWGVGCAGEGGHCPHTDRPISTLGIGRLMVTLMLLIGVLVPVQYRCRQFYATHSRNGLIYRHRHIYTRTHTHTQSYAETRTV